MVENINTLCTCKAVLFEKWVKQLLLISSSIIILYFMFFGFAGCNETSFKIISSQNRQKWQTILFSAGRPAWIYSATYQQIHW